MIDIVSVGTDIGIFDTQTARAKNILATQLGSLTYAPDLGIDLKYFLAEDFRFQNESFKSYLIERLANFSINVSSVVEDIENLFTQYTFNIGTDSTGGGLVSR